jgi:hypothetical protein
MWIVAAAASHLTFAIRHVRRALELRATHLMTLQAQFWLLRFCAVNISQRLVETNFAGELAALRLMAGVAIHASYVASFVRTSGPEQTIASLVT